VVGEIGSWATTSREASPPLAAVFKPLSPGLGPAPGHTSIAGWIDVQAGDELLALAILDRLLRLDLVLTLAIHSYRLRELERAVRAPRKQLTARLVVKTASLTPTAGWRRHRSGRELPRSTDLLIA